MQTANIPLSIIEDKRILQLTRWALADKRRVISVGKFLSILITTDDYVFSFQELKDKLQYGDNQLERIISLSKKVGLISTRTIDNVSNKRTFKQYSLNKVSYRAYFMALFLGFYNKAKKFDKKDDFISPYPQWKRKKK